MKAKLVNMRTFETHRGIAWNAKLRTNDDASKTVDIPIENRGDGGMTHIRAYTPEQRQAVEKLREWAKKHLPNDDFALETICDFTDNNESLEKGVQIAIQHLPWLGGAK